jgi:hypothetical protein
MSKYMQLKVEVQAYYPQNLEDTYPHLARNLKSLAPDLAEKNPSLYAIAAQLDKLLYTFDGTPVREILLRHQDNLRRLYKEITAHIADWHLAEADPLLYQLEDIFDKIDSELG